LGKGGDTLKKQRRQQQSSQLIVHTGKIVYGKVLKIGHFLPLVCLL
jgi:hypothetical protein